MIAWQFRVINQNYFQYNNNLSLKVDEEPKKLDLLKGERDPGNSILKIKNNIIFPKNIYNSNRNKIITNIRQEIKLKNFRDESKLYSIILNEIIIVSTKGHS